MPSQASDRQPPATRRIPSARLALAVGALLGILVVPLTYDDYGPTWDEAIQARYGELAFAYFASGGEDTRANEYLDLRYYGPLVEMLPVLVGVREGAARYELRHLVLGLLALLVLPAAWSYGRLLGGVHTAWIALPAVALQPRFYGHWFNNSKDLPFAVLTVWFLYAVGLLIARRRPSWSNVLLAGALLGLAACVRPGGLPLLVAYLGSGLLLRGLGRELRQGAPGEAGRELTARLAAAIRSWGPRLAVLLALAWVILVLPWPWAHQAPFAHPLEAMRLTTDFPTTMPVLFAGETVPSDALPRSYPLHYLLVTTPLPLLLLAAAGLLLGWRRRPDPVPGRRAMLGLTIIWLGLPLALFALLRPNVYGGMRHFLFLVPAVGLLAARGGDEILRSLSRRGPRIAAAVLLAAALLQPLVPMVRLHPYQMTYYNALVGGVAGASGRYWTDYSLSSYAEAIRWVNRQPRPSRSSTTLVVAGGPPILEWARAYAADGVEVELLRHYPGRQRPRLAPDDYYVGGTRLSADRAFPASPVVYTVGRAGAVFSVVRRGEPEPAAEAGTR